MKTKLLPFLYLAGCLAGAGRAQAIESVEVEVIVIEAMESVASGAKDGGATAARPAYPRAITESGKTVELAATNLHTHALTRGMMDSFKISVTPKVSGDTVKFSGKIRFAYHEGEKQREVSQSFTGRGKLGESTYVLSQRVGKGHNALLTLRFMKLAMNLPPPRPSLSPRP
ncbi:MAG: hypothetical protein HY301_20980 [Verrucomicrobia bacterium]|nr:hypothetical protein [Verrucomicrobiota bacterium]